MPPATQTLDARTIDDPKRARILERAMKVFLAYGFARTTMYDIARYQIRPVLSRVPGVGRVDVQASDVREIEVVADPVRLAEQGLSYDDLAGAIRSATSPNAVGRVAQDYKQLLVVTATEATRTEDVANVVEGIVLENS